ncbi:uncharacterized protein ASPGLDRAFT_39281 [Aspergillus glaucus CBS 516.65]|uniref:Uncharacterized protein n=1 Tax=Aspergillus glaucus CBS 516.65 TaxID=1160497 RepID=A0A1L9V8T9_ASPGL|nr:hypothetical protein ASPGLDRAFT_39281 [Aspergillus glaucus CBS 516.65]OJJ80285.1 hypothetical protein ASPGLDRAFT_39281 [Aspergillus glaucus CBS 516.65]
MAQTKVLFTGATGYIGGSVLTALTTSQNPAIKNGTKVTALIRKQEQAQVLDRAGINALLFNGLDDVAQMERLARDHVVIHTASTLHTETIEAMIAGLGARKKDTGREIFFIHLLQNPPVNRKPPRPPQRRRRHRKKPYPKRPHIHPHEEVGSISLEDAAGKWLGGNTVFTETVFASK